MYKETDKTDGLNETKVFKSGLERVRGGEDKDGKVSDNVSDGYFWVLRLTAPSSSVTAI